MLSKSFLSLPFTVIILAIVGFLINIASTMTYSQIAMYMKIVLGATPEQIARVDGLVEALSHVTRIVSGVLSDLLHNRKGFLVMGHFLNLLAKPIYLFSSTLFIVFFAQVVDRLSNGIIAAPRDALVGDVADADKRGASYGFLKSLKTVGSMLGALIAILIMANTANDFSMVFAIAIVPAFFSLILLILFVKKPTVHRQEKEKRFKFTRKNLKEIGSPFWKIIGLASFFELAHFSEGLLSLRAHEVGLPTTYIGTVMMIMNTGQFLLAYPLGLLSDRFNRKLFLGIAFLFMVGANLFLGFSHTYLGIMCGIFLWGAQMSTSQSIFMAMMNDVVSKDLRGTAFGIFYLLSGICYLVASELAGFLWGRYGSFSAFMVSALIASLSIFFLLALKERRSYP